MLPEPEPKYHREVQNVIESHRWGAYEGFASPEFWEQLKQDFQAQDKKYEKFFAGFNQGFHKARKLTQEQEASLLEILKG